MVDILEKDEEVLLTKKGEIRKRKPKTKNNYFTIETEEAILEYRNTPNQAKRNKIYNERIHYGFYKLVENIIHTFKFYYTEVENIEDLKYEVISFLLQKIDLYDQSKGKAYSYFGTIAKRYLIIYNQKNYKKLVSKAEIGEQQDDNALVNSIIVKEPEPELDKLDIVELFIKYVDDFIYVKEMTDTQSNTITKVIKKLKTIYKTILDNYLENSDY